MKNFSSGFGLLIMVVIVGMVAALIVKYGTSSTRERRRELDAVMEDDPSSEPNGETKPRTVKKQMEDKLCRTNCESAARTCRGLAEDESGKMACDTELRGCLAGCP